MSSLPTATLDHPPMVSIGLPLFNGENYLAEAIRPALNQRFADFEMIVCDNASTDRTGEIAEGFAAVDPCVRYARNPANLGAAPNYNRAFDLACGRYFKWLAHDDRLLPDYLTRTVEAMEARPELVLCNSRVEVFDETAGISATMPACWTRPIGCRRPSASRASFSSRRPVSTFSAWCVAPR